MIQFIQNFCFPGPTIVSSNLEHIRTFCIPAVMYCNYCNYYHYYYTK